MAETDAYSKRLVSAEVAPPPPPPATPQQSKFFSRFLYKALSVAVVLVILPLFPSQAPEFINQTIFTRSWELLRLLFVGIAVSYGLFSRRNVETEKENQVKIDTTQTYMSRILQVSSVFDDDMETPFGPDENKVETWNSKYFRGEPHVVVEPDSSVLDEQSSVIKNVGNKPLFLPVRNLKSAVSDPVSGEFFNDSTPCSLSRSASGLKNGSSTNSDRNRDGDFGDMDPLDLEEKVNENVVLSSPIPWRSRSGRMEMKEEMGGGTPPLYSLPPSAEESEFNQHKLRSFSLPMSRSSQPKSTSPSPKKLSPSSSLSPELRTKSTDDPGKKKSAYKSSPPPPPPPPLPTPNTRLCSQRYRNTLNSSSFGDEFSSEKELSRSGREDLQRRSENEALSSFKDEMGELGRSGRENLQRRSENEPKSCFKDEMRDLSRSGRENLQRRSEKEMKSDFQDEMRDLGSNGREDQRRSEKNTKSGFKDEMQDFSRSGRENLQRRNEKDRTSSFKDEMKDLSRSGREDLLRRRDSGMDSLKSESKSRNHVEGSLMGRSVRKIRGSEPVADARKFREFGDQDDDAGMIDKKRYRGVDEMLMEKPNRRTGGFEPQPMSTENQNYESRHPRPKPTFSEYHKKENKKMVQKVILESEEYSSSETEDDFQVSSATEETNSNSVDNAGTDPNEVDKKADEFIAKFREQIRLQRIESIKRSTGQHSSRNSR